MGKLRNIMVGGGWIKHVHKYFATINPQTKQKHRWGDSAHVCSAYIKVLFIYGVEKIKTICLQPFDVAENAGCAHVAIVLCLIFLVSFLKLWHFPSKVCNPIILQHTHTQNTLHITCNWKLTTTWCQAILRQVLSNM